MKQVCDGRVEFDENFRRKSSLGQRVEVNVEYEPVESSI